jgi:hypothetical protein
MFSHPEIMPDFLTVETANSPSYTDPFYAIFTHSIGRRPKILYTVANGGADRNRTDDLLNAIQALSQLSYGPTLGKD